VSPVVLGLDISWTSTGVAVADGAPMTGYPEVSRIRTAPSKFRGVHDRLEFIIRAILNRVDDTQPDLICVEGLLTQSAQSLATQGGIFYCVTHELWRAKWPMAVIGPPTLKAFATGKGTAGKPQMMVAAAMRLGRADINDDECDALWLVAAGLQHLGRPLVKMPQAQIDRLYGLNKKQQPVIYWPKLRPTPSVSGSLQ